MRLKEIGPQVDCESLIYLPLFIILEFYFRYRMFPCNNAVYFLMGIDYHNNFYLLLDSL